MLLRVYQASVHLFYSFFHEAVRAIGQKVLNPALKFAAKLRSGHAVPTISCLKRLRTEQLAAIHLRPPETPLMIQCISRAYYSVVACRGISI